VERLFLSGSRSSRSTPHSRPMLIGNRCLSQSRCCSSASVMSGCFRSRGPVLPPSVPPPVASTPRRFTPRSSSVSTSAFPFPSSEIILHFGRSQGFRSVGPLAQLPEPYLSSKKRLAKSLGRSLIPESQRNDPVTPPFLGFIQTLSLRMKFLVGTRHNHSNKSRRSDPLRFLRFFCRTKVFAIPNIQLTRLEPAGFESRWLRIAEDPCITFMSNTHQDRKIATSPEYTDVLRQMLRMNLAPLKEIWFDLYNCLHNGAIKFYNIYSTRIADKHSAWPPGGINFLNNASPKYHAC